MEERLRIDGMHCASCAAGIESYLSSRDGILEASVDYEKGVAHIKTTENAELDTIQDHLQAMGYGVE